MKNFIKAMCGILVIGIIVCVAGLAAGGNLYTSYYNGEVHSITQSFRDGRDFYDNHFPFGLFSWHRGISDEWYDASWYDYDDTAFDEEEWYDNAFDDDAYASMENSADASGNVDLSEDFHSLELKLQRGNYVIVQGDTLHVSQGKISVQIIDDTLIVSCRAPRRYSKQIVLTIPTPTSVEGKYDKFSLTLDASALEVDTPIFANAFSTAASAASIDFEQTITANSVSIAAKAGALEIHLIDANTIYMNCNAASVEAKLAGNVKQYQAENIMSNLSEITLNGHIFSSSSTSNAKRSISIDANASSVQLQTKD